MNTVVIGVGTRFRHDDGAGPELVAALDELVPPDTRLAVCDGEPTRMIELWNGARLAVVVDAAVADDAAGLRPGDVVRWDSAWDTAPPGDGPVAPVIRSDAGGTHSLGPGAAIELAAVLDRLPGHLVVLAVVGADFEPGEGLSPPVAAAVARLTRTVAGELAREGR